MAYTLNQVAKATAQTPARYVVSVNGKEIGLVEKYRNTKTETHPWKAFTGIGMACKIKGFFYEADGGKEAAIKAVIEG